MVADLWCCKRRVNDWNGGELAEPCTATPTLPQARLAAALTARQTMAADAGGKWSTPEETNATRAEVWLRCLGRLSPGFEIVSITDDVREFLRMDGIMLPSPPPGHEMKERDPRYESPEGAEGGLSLDEFPDSPTAASGDDGDASSEASALKPPPAMVEFQEAISAALEALGPMVLPRLSWVTPWDGAWMNGEEAQCGSVGEVLTVLKASDAVTEAMDETCAAPGGAPSLANAVLVLLDFDDVFARPERCFRAFVRDGQLIALSQLRATRFLPEAKALREVAVAAAEALVNDVCERPITDGAESPVYLNTCEQATHPHVAVVVVVVVLLLPCNPPSSAHSQSRRSGRLALCRKLACHCCTQHTGHAMTNRCLYAAPPLAPQSWWTSQ